jgi:hypothetical protein
LEAEPVSHRGWLIPLTASFGMSGLVAAELKRCAPVFEVE